MYGTGDSSNCQVRWFSVGHLKVCRETVNSFYWKKQNSWIYPCRVALSPHCWTNFSTKRCWICYVERLRRTYLSLIKHVALIASCQKKSWINGAILPPLRWAQWCGSAPPDRRGCRSVSFKTPLIAWLEHHNNRVMRIINPICTDGAVFRFVRASS